MAGTQRIHFPLWAQLGWQRDHTPADPPILGPPHVLKLLRALFAMARSSVKTRLLKVCGCHWARELVGQ
jgi:hypothetical protein